MIKRKNFGSDLLAWYEKNGRDFLWRRKNLTPFQIFLIQMCLKRTKPSAVENIAGNILKHIGQIDKIQAKESNSLEEILSPLGLQAKRSGEIYGLANTLSKKYSGKVPRDRQLLLQMKGVGPYVADAVLCFAFCEKVVVVDSNVLRVAEKYFGPIKKTKGGVIREVKSKLEPKIPKGSIKKFNWALIDLGTYLRKPNKQQPNKD